MTAETETRRRMLIDAIRAASMVRCDLILWERDEPLAPEVFRAWAATVEAVVVERPIDDADAAAWAADAAARAAARAAQIEILRRMIGGGS